MEYFISTSCYSEYKKLLKNSKKYGCLPKSIYLLFNEKSIDYISKEGYLLTKSKTVQILKKRAKSCGNNGKSSGFRVLCIINPEAEFIGIFMIYPKWGSAHKENAVKKEWKEELKSFAVDKKNGKLKSFKLEHKTKTIRFE